MGNLTQPFVQSLKAAAPVRPSLHRTVPEATGTPAQLPPGHLTAGGANAIVGIVDFGCDFAHANLRDASGKSRVQAFWNQLGTTTADSPFGYGRVHRKSQIDAALPQSDPYTALGYGPDPDVRDVRPMRAARSARHIGIGAVAECSVGVGLQ